MALGRFFCGVGLALGRFFCGVGRFLGCVFLGIHRLLSQRHPVTSQIPLDLADSSRNGSGIFLTQPTRCLGILKLL